MKILLLDNNHSSLQKGLEELGYQCDTDYSSSKEAVEKKLSSYVGVVIRSRFLIDQHFIDAGTNLQFIARVGAGIESIDSNYAQLKGIEVLAAPEGNANAVGEHTLGLLLSLFQKLNQADGSIRQGKWLRELHRGIELEGKTVGIIGYGNMGKSFAKKLQGFDVEVICYDIKPNVGDQFCRQVTLAELQQDATIISIHTPHNKSSFQMINTAFINQFIKPFFLINTGRGTAVVTEDLVNAIKDNRILGAGLDVLEYEKTSFENLFENKNLPPTFDYLIHSEKVILTPHIAGWTIESRLKLAKVIVSKIQALEII